MTVRRVLASLVVLGLIALVADKVIYSALSRTTSSGSGAFAAGTVDVTDNDNDVAALPLSSALPGAADTGTDYRGAGAGVVVTGPLSTFPTSYAAEIVDPAAGSPEVSTTSDAHSYRLTVTLNNDAAAHGLSAPATFRWEARNL